MLNDAVSIGTALPHRSYEPIAPNVVRRSAEAAESLGFADLWVTENIVDHAWCLEPFSVLSFAAARTKEIGLGVAVSILPTKNPVHTAHAAATLDVLSSGRARLGVGLGSEQDFLSAGVKMPGRVKRFEEYIEIVRRLWEGEEQLELQFFRGAVPRRLSPTPVQERAPIILGGLAPPAVRRAARYGVGWIGAGGQSRADFKRSVKLLKDELAAAGRADDDFLISKRVFVAVDDKHAVAEAMARRWFEEVYRGVEKTYSHGIFGTPDSVADQLEELCDVGINHIVVNPVARYEEQLGRLAQLAGLPARM